MFSKKKKNKFKTFKNINNHFHNDNNPLVTFENDSWPKSNVRMNIPIALERSVEESGKIQVKILLIL